MKTFSVLALGVIVGLSAAPRLTAAAQYGRARADQVCVYKDINFQGVEQCYRAGDQMNNLGVQSKSISSIRVYGRGTVTVFEKAGFSGRSAEFTSDVPDLGRRMMAGNTSWSDHIESLRIGGVTSNGSPDVIERRTPGDLRRNPQQQPRDGICVYDRPNYEGRSECWDEGQNVSDLSRQGNWNGQISSVRVFGRSMAVVYRDAGYRGESMTIDRDMPDLAAQGGKSTGNNGNGRGRGRGRGNNNNSGNWDRQISSFQVQAQRRNQ